MSHKRASRLKPSSGKETMSKEKKMEEAEEEPQIPNSGRGAALSSEPSSKGPGRQKWTWEDPMYALQSNYEAYARKPEVKWQKSDFEESDFFALESEQKTAFMEMVFEPLPMPQRIGITRANYKEADLIRFPPSQDTASREMARPPAPEAKESRPGDGAAASLRTPVTIKTDGLREEGMVYPVSPGCKPQ